MHRRISAYNVDRSASKSTPLNSHLVLNSLMYFRSISTASDVHDHFLGLFVVDSDAKDAFRFPCDFFDFSRGKALFHIFPRRAAFHGTLVDNLFMIICLFFEMSTLLSSNCFELCSDDLATTERRIFPGLIRAQSHYRVSRQSDSNPIPQKLTFLGGCTFLKCLHGKKLALAGGLPYQPDRVILPLGWPYLSCKPNRKIQ